ncbi:hypothetical protein [Fodinicurvata sediminis]|uniref:hypothetical protein n=1 Tax=Fodinicurvata sediminis TaxID=1121832 RepID=UPI0012DE7073|nr:hypothetical protein [Fodinicurvata sediminis]
MSGVSLEDFLGWRLHDERFDTELWKFEYDCNRYLKNTTEDHLADRYIAICRNIRYLVCPLRDSVPIKAHFLSTWWWLRKFVHLNYEYQLRGSAPPSSDKTEVPDTPSVQPVSIPRHPNASDFVVRYSEERFLSDFVMNGTVRIAPASSYRGEHLNEDRRDDELNKHRFLRGDLTRITKQDGSTIRVIGDVQRTTSYSVNYYTLCCSTEHDSRLYPAFPNSSGEPANAFVVIWDIDAFARRLEIAAAQHLKGWYFHYIPVRYFDPYEWTPKEDIDPGTSKDFRYAFQREYRFLWFPLHGGVAKEPIFLNLGSLTDIAGLYRHDGKFIGGKKT